MRKLLFMLACTLVFTATCVGCQKIEDFEANPSQQAENPEPESSSAPMENPQTKLPENIQPEDLASALSETFAKISKRAILGVVNISSERVVKTPQFPFMDDPFFRRFFERFPFNTPPEQKTKSLGSGVLVSEDGYIVTNNHVIEGAEDIKISLPDGSERKAKVIGKDPASDLALLKIDPQGIELHPLKFGDSDNIKVGEIVLAIGNPFGFGHTITMGIISATGRTNLGITDYENFIQTDAAINPGNSGGALINIKGELIGVNTAIFSRTGGYQGIGFAIPSNMVSSIMNSLIKEGKVIRGWLGVMIQDVTPELAQAFKLEKNEGALVSKVFSGSPAEAAGFQRGDVIIEFNGKKIKNINELRNLVAATAPGTSVKVKVIHNNKEIVRTVIIGELPEKVEAEQERPVPEERSEEEKSFLGLYLSDITPSLRKRFGIEADVEGVLIIDIDPSSDAAQKGLQRGDVIIEINHEKVKNLKELQAAFEKGKGKPYLLLIDHGGGQTSYVVLEK